MGFGQREERWESSPLSERRSNLDSNLGHMATVMNFYKSEYEQHSIKKKLDCRSRSHHLSQKYKGIISKNEVQTKGLIIMLITL